MAQESESTAKRAELPMRLTRLRVKNFRSIADIDIPLSPLTVLVGPNGSGKSNVVDALRFVRDVLAHGLDQAVMDREGMGVVQRWGTEGEGVTIGITVELPEMVNPHKYGSNPTPEPAAKVDYEFCIGDLHGEGLVVIGESILINAKGEPPMKVVVNEEGEFVEYGKRQWKRTNFDSDFWQRQDVNGPEIHFMKSESYLFGDGKWSKKYVEENGYSWRRNGIAAIRTEKEIHDSLFYNLNPSDLRQPQKMVKESPYDENGRNLAAVLRSLFRTGGGANWDGLLFALRQTVPGFSDIEVESVGGYLATKLLYHNGTAKSRASYLGQESDGTIRMMGLLAALYQEPAQPFICIEEPEANIHPGALAILAGVIDEASLRSQILVTTHSPDMLDHLPVESFLVVEKVGDTTHVGPLDASQISSVRKRLFTPGELFRMEGLQRQTESAS
ncbi:AAA family ATPase [Hymenobacter ruricola]|uniref:AAA family ATPase n=1 Tax=Hymenobacter ruricola TaxID=2791023 RepID=A0ABS0I738_9BACT|nr:AAA family ATPase [Hymenobacter ruricola]MBF9222789.1 AAA family ATPase [Hymenobacter ruricola]